MKLSFSILFVLTIFMTGCQGPVDNNIDDEFEKVTLKGTNSFPEQMVGIWEEKSQGWIIKFEKDGSIKKLRHTIGRIKLIDGQKTTFPLIDDGEGFMDPGPWKVIYTNKDRFLTVEIAITGFKYNIPGTGIISGSSVDLFMGEIPVKGGNEWRVDWISVPEFVASTADKKFQNYKLPSDPGDEIKGELVFEKLELSPKE